MGRRTNLALAVLLVAAVISGLASQAIGLDWALDTAVIHGVVALAILLLAPWKSTVVRRGLKKSRPGRSFSLVLLGVVLLTLFSGLIHSHGELTRIGSLTVMQIHVGGAILALGLVIDHFRRHPVTPRRFDLDRRAFLRTSTLAATAAGIWVAWEGALQAMEAPGSERRFTGMHQRGSHDPAALPTTSWFDDQVPRIDGAEWTVDVAGRTLSLAELDEVAGETFPAILDCTGGWYSEQQWSGVRLDRLVDPAGNRSFVAWSRSGYARRFPIRDLKTTWLVTRLGGEPLSPGHGFPARIVAPARRGFWWVKWVTRIELSPVPWWLQSPFPLT
ncbi:MAG: molybdopterin-dependent oxidoreductase [Acidimicrobiia bacterium]